MKGMATTVCGDIRYKVWLSMPYGGLLHFWNTVRHYTSLDLCHRT